MTAISPKLRDVLKLGVWTAAMVLLCAQVATAQAVRVHASADSVYVGQRFMLSITVEHAPELRVTFPGAAESDSAFGDLLILGEREPAQRTTGATVVDSMSYEVATFAIDTASVPSLGIRIAGSGASRMLPTPAFTLSVISIVPPDAQDIRDLTPLETFPRTWWPYILLGLALGGAAYGLWRRWRSRLRPVNAPAPAEQLPEHTPYEKALERLGELEKMNLKDPAANKAFYTGLSETLREYVEAAMHTAALEMTTRELIMELRRRPDMTYLEVLRPMQSVLEFADLVKFAKANPPIASGSAALEETRKILRMLESARARLPATHEPATAHAA